MIHVSYVSSFSCLHLIFRQVDFSIHDLNTVCNEQFCLRICLAEREFSCQLSLCIYHAKARNVLRVGVPVKCITDRPCHFLLPASSATCLYVATLPFGIFFTAS